MAGKIEIAERVFVKGKDTGMTLAHARRVVNMTFDSIIDALEEGSLVQVRGFGSFKIVERKGFVRKSPLATGGEMIVPPRRVLKFKSLINKNLE